MRFIIEVEVTNPKLFEVYTSGFARGPLIDRIRRMVNTGAHMLHMPQLNGIRIVEVREVPTPNKCQRCGEAVFTIPADPADWPDGVLLWVTEDGTWGCKDDHEGVHLHLPLASS